MVRNESDVFVGIVVRSVPACAVQDHNSDSTKVRTDNNATKIAKHKSADELPDYTATKPPWAKMAISFLVVVALVSF